MKKAEARQTDRVPKIVIADDEPWFVQPLRDAFEVEGYQVENARTGSAALSMVQSKDTRPDVLILDIMMNPGELEGPHEEGTRTGLLVLEVIRQRLRISAASLPIICLTIVEDEGVRNRIEELGAVYLAKKDFKMPELVQRIRSITSGHQR